MPVEFSNRNEDNVALYSLGLESANWPENQQPMPYVNSSRLGRNGVQSSFFNDENCMRVRLSCDSLLSS